MGRRRRLKAVGGSTAFLFLILIIALALTGIIPIDGENNEDGPGTGDTEASVRFMVEGDNPAFDCYVADTGAERSKGLMDVKDLEDDRGMLFVYDPPDLVSFWMKNTLIGLDIIFISSELKVVSVHEASPGAGLPDEEVDRFTSEQAVAYVLEINRGLSASYGIGPGTTVLVDM